MAFDPTTAVLYVGQFVSSDLYAMADQYAAIVLDVAHLGLGADGHTASLLMRVCSRSSSACRRSKTSSPMDEGLVVHAESVLGGLHHEYSVVKATT